MTEDSTIRIDELPDQTTLTDETILLTKQGLVEKQTTFGAVRDAIVEPLAETILTEITPEVQAAAEAAAAAAATELIGEYEEVLEAIKPAQADDTTAFRVADKRGRVAIAVDAAGDVRTAAFMLKKSAQIDDIGFVDKRKRMIRVGDLVARILAGGSDGGGVTPSGNFTEAEIAALDAQALGARDAVVSNGNHALRKMMAGYNHIFQNGQSFSVGALGWPRKTKTQLYDARMLGNSVRYDGGNVAVFTPYGSNTLMPLQATVEGPGGDTDILSDADVANRAILAITPSYDTARGETAAVGCADYAKFLFNQSMNGGANDAGKQFVVTSTGFGGISIEDLSNPSLNHYLRSLDAADKVKARAVAEGKAIGVGLFIWEQGQHNAAPTSNDNMGTSRESYYNSLMNFRANCHQDICITKYGQSLKSVWLMSQTSGKWTYDSTDHAVAMAQLDANLNSNDMAVAFPEYFVTNNADGHPDSNAYVWMGMMFAKVYHRMVTLGQGWRPLHITRAVKRGNQILLSYHVPFPPLTFRDYYNVKTAMNSTQKGFRVVDGAGELIVNNVEIKGSATILITVGRTLTGTVKVRYADQTGFLGGGNVFDSDSALSVRSYNYSEADGDIPEVNIAALVNKPYPLNNPACQQIVTALAA